jgi:hypothetical protein
MAKAKSPKQDREEQAKIERLTRAQQVLKVHPLGTDLTFHYPAHNVPMAVEREIIRLARKTRHELVTSSLHGFVCAWWVTRLIAGETVTLAEVEAEWDERCAGTTLSTVETEWITAPDPVGTADEDDSPEA